MSRGLFVLIAIAAAVWAMYRWRLGVQAAMVLLVFEGAIRKWVLPGSEALVYFGKDLVLLGCYAGFFGRSGRLARLARVPPGLTALLVAAAAYGGLAIANPREPSLLLGLFGFKSYFLYVPLVFIVPAMFNSEAELTRFLYRYALLAIPVGLLAAVQFRSPSSSMINTYAWNPGADFQAITFGSSPEVRVTGTFSFITGYSTYVFTIALVILALLAARRWRIRKNVPLLAALFFSMVGMLMTGSRGPVLQLLLVFPVYLWFSIVKARGGAAALGRILVIVAFGAAMVSQAFFPAAEAFFTRAQGTEDVPSRVLSPFVDPYYAFGVGGFFGDGIGTTHQAAEKLGAPTSPPGIAGPATEEAFEGESGRVMAELGLVGFVLFYGARIVVIFLALRYISALKRPTLRGLGTASLLILVSSLPGSIVFNVTGGLLYWFFVGILFAVVRFDRLATYRQAQTTQPAETRRKAVGPAPAVAGQMRRSLVARR
jgi:hypothetical protein